MLDEDTATDDMRQIVHSLYDAADVSEDARQETQVDSSVGVAYIPRDALNEIAETVDSRRAEEGSDG